MLKYKYNKSENKFTENGHTMFEEDVLKRLERLSFLEEKLRWIPITEKLPEDCQELSLSKCKTKDVLIKRKWLDTGEIKIEINCRFRPSSRIGFLWNYEYEGSIITEWRSFL